MTKHFAALRDFIWVDYEKRTHRGSHTSQKVIEVVKFYFMLNGTILVGFENLRGLGLENLCAVNDVHLRDSLIWWQPI